MTLREDAWGATVSGLRPLLPAAGLLGPKAAAASAGRRAAAARLESWGRSRRPSAPPLLWLHGASAGELLGAAPAVERLRRSRELELLVTHTSPSAEAALPDLRPDAAEYLPLDTAAACRRAVRGVAPSALVFARGDLWPNLTRAAAGAGVPMGMVNATVRPGSTRLRPVVRALLRPGYGRLERVGAATEGDARRLRRLGVDGEALEVTGDAAVDRALAEASPTGDEREDGPARRLAELAPDGHPVLVAGSTWPPDEELLVEVQRRLVGRGASSDGAGPGSPGQGTAESRWRSGSAPLLVLVPHEPGPGARERIGGLCRERLGSEPAVWEEEGPPRPSRVDDVLVVNRTGLLARLYGAADLAWVGGGLGDDGLHSVVEPAAAGVPVLFGPLGDRWEARALVKRGAARRIGGGDPAGAVPALGALLDDLLADRALRREMGRAARAFVEESSGAAERGAGLVAGLLDPSG